MPFPPQVVEDLLVKSARCCCLCHKHKRTKIQVHHIIQEADGGINDFDNGIPLCFDCHTEVKAYNNRHPLGTKYRPSELKRRRDQCFHLVASGKLPRSIYKHTKSSQKKEQRRQRIIRNGLLWEIKDNSRIAIARDPVGNVLSTNAWQTYRSEADDFLYESLVTDMSDLYDLIMETNNIISRLEAAYRWTVEQHERADWHISSLQTRRDRNYETIKEKAARIIEQLESRKNQL